MAFSGHRPALEKSSAEEGSAHAPGRPGPRLSERRLDARWEGGAAGPGDHRRATSTGRWRGGAGKWGWGAVLKQSQDLSLSCCVSSESDIGTDLLWTGKCPG